MSQAANKIPAWVKSGVLARHISSDTLFWIGHVLRSPNKQIYLCDYPRGEAGEKFLLDECEPGSIAHFKTIAIVSQNGTLISVVREPATAKEKDQRDKVIFFTDDHRVVVRIDPNAWCDPTVMSASQSIASFFQGSAIGKYEEVV